MPHRQIVTVAAITGAFFGSHFLGLLEEQFFQDPDITKIFTSKTIVGGLIGGLITVELSKKIIGEKRSSGDLIVFPLVTAMILGRIGCFLTGVSDKTVGTISSLPWALDQGDGILRHPTSLYEILFLFTLGMTLSLLKRKGTLSDGKLFQYFLFSYCFFRFLVEFIKPVEPFVGPLSAIQLAVLLTMFYYMTRSKNIYE